LLENGSNEIQISGGLPYRIETKTVKAFAGFLENIFMPLRFIGNQYG
jgi:hypothetical protein